MNSGKPKATVSQGNPEPSLERKLFEGVETTLKAYRGVISMAIRSKSAGPQLIKLGDDIVRHSRETWRAEDKEPQYN